MDSSNASIRISPMLEEYRKEGGMSTIPTDREKELCYKLIHIGNMTVGKYTIERITGSIWDLWNVYSDGKNLFCLSETLEGYSIRNSKNDDSWINDLLLVI